MPADERRRRSALALLDALDVFEAATLAVSAETAVPNVRSMVGTVPAEELARVAVVLAVEAVWALPPAADLPRTDREIRERLVQVRAWVQRKRLEALWVAS